MVYALVWGIGWRRLGCGCGRRLVTGSCVIYIRETTQTGRPWSWPRVSLYLSISPTPLFILCLFRADHVPLRDRADRPMTFSTPTGRRSGGSGPRRRVSPSKSASHPEAPGHRLVKTFGNRRGGCVAIGLCLLIAGFTVCYQILYQQKVPAANQTWRPAYQPVQIGGLAHTEHTLAPGCPACPNCQLLAAKS